MKRSKKKHTQLKRPCTQTNKKTMKTHVKNEEEEMPSIDSPPTTAIVHKAFLFEQKKRIKKKKAAEKKRIDKRYFFVQRRSNSRGPPKKSPSYKQPQIQKKKLEKMHTQTQAFHPPHRLVFQDRRISLLVRINYSMEKKVEIRQQKKDRKT